MTDVLRDYALLADGERGVAIDPHGDLAWMCAPRWDSGSVFSSMVGGHGRYQVAPTGRFVWGGYYEPGTLIWRSRWITADAEVECREALAFPGTPGVAIVLRQVHVLHGSVEIEILLRPRADYDTAPLRTVHSTDLGWTGRAGDLHVRWSGDVADATVGPDGHGGRQLQATHHLVSGDRIDLVLELSAQPPDAPPPEPSAAWAATAQGWARARPHLSTLVAERDAHHAWAVLRGLTGTHGAMVAAATTSLPERAEAGRNYDYRYAWIRDQCYAGMASAAAGATDLLDDAVGFVTARLLDDGPDLKPAYTVDGGRIPDQRPLDLPGYPGASMRLGNHVNQQFQLDGFGEALTLFAAAADQDRLDESGRQASRLAVDAIGTRWQEPDAGVWELDQRRWTHSRLSCVAGLRAIARAAPTAVDTNQTTALADRILAHESAHCLHPSGRWQRADDDERVDAALLLAAIRGAVTPDDPRSTATLDAVRRDLSVGEYVYRYRIDERPLGRAEGAFLLCGFWMALACAQQGDRLAAARWFERSRSACGPPGLLTEEFDVGQRQLRGNLPQAFVHALLLECCATLDVDTPLTP
jgi:hypothetical protein